MICLSSFDFAHSQKLFATFNCTIVDGVRYLRADLSINCDSDVHKRAEGFAG